jgi:hypothetical protein
LRRFWNFENIECNGFRLVVSLKELLPDEDSNDGIVGVPLIKTIDSTTVTVVFDSIAGFRVVPEIMVWPPPDEAEFLNTFLVRRSGESYFEHEGIPKEIYYPEKGWVHPSEVQHFTVHSESYDVQVLSEFSPRVENSAEITA